MRKFIKHTMLIAVLSVINAQAKANNLGLSVAYNNPIGASLGVNLAMFFQNIQLEGGIGAVNLHFSSNAISGAFNIKYRFMSGSFRPYLGAGIGLGLGNISGDIYAGASGVFAGGGLLYEGNSLFSYIGANMPLNNRIIFPLIGVGLKI